MEKKYKRMLKVMAQKPEFKENWFLYILGCRDGSLYTGITNNIVRRVKMHQKGAASRYTRTRLPVSLLYQEAHISRTQALVRECAVKAYSRERKLELIASGNSQNHGSPVA